MAHIELISDLVNKKESFHCLKPGSVKSKGIILYIVEIRVGYTLSCAGARKGKAKAVRLCPGMLTVRQNPL